MLVFIIVLSILAYALIGGVTLALIDKLYDTDADDLEGAIILVFLFSPLILTCIGGYELGKRILENRECHKKES